MELVVGVDFESYVGTNVERLRLALRELAAALDALHRGGLVHRDVKPSNVLVTTAGRLALLDLGLVHDAIRPSWLDQETVGTTAFMAPELRVSSHVTPAADWYAVGVMLRRFLERASGVLDDRTSARLWSLANALLGPEPKMRAGFSDIIEQVEGNAVRSNASDALREEMEVVGRTETLEHLDTLRREAWNSGTVRAAFVHGPSGIGKSTILDRFARSVAGRARVLRGSCYEQESVTYKGLDGVVEDLAGHLLELDGNAVSSLKAGGASLLGRAFPALAAVPGLPTGDNPGPGTLAQLATALRELLLLLSRDMPLVLMIDDFQWADRDAANLLDRLLGSEIAMPLLLVIGSREEQAPELGIALERVAIGPLDADAATRLVQQLVRDRDQVDVTALVLEGEGHPLYLAELVRHTNRPGRSQRPRLDDALIERTGRLGERARELLRLVTLAAAPVQREVLARASGLDAEAFLDAMDQLRREGWTVSTGPKNRDLVDAFHDRGREALRATVPTDDARTLHDKLATAYRDLAPDAHDRLAFHYRAAGHENRAYEHALQAARRAEEALAFDHAARLYQMALELGPDPEGRIAEALGQALVAANRPLDAAAAFRKATDQGSDGPRRRAMLARAAGQLLAGGEVHAGMTQLYDVLDSLGITAPRTQKQALFALVRSRISLRLFGPRWGRFRRLPASDEVRERIDVLHTAGTALLLVDAMRGVPLHAHSLFLARRADDRFRLARSLAMESCRQSTGGRVDLADRAAREALELSRDMPASRLRYIHRAARAVGAFRRGAWEDTLREHAQGADDREALRGTPWELSSALLYAQLARLQAGRLDEWRRNVALGSDEARRRRDNNLQLCVDVSGGVLVPLLEGDLAGARLMLESVERRLWDGTGFMRIVAYLLRVWLDLYANDLEGAQRVIVQGHGRPEVRFVSREIHFTGSWLAYSQASLELASAPDRRAVRRRADKTIRHLSSGVPWTVPLAEILRARREYAAGRAEHAGTLLDAAVARARTDGHHLIASAAAVARLVWTSDNSPSDVELRTILNVADPVAFARMFVPALRPVSDAP